MKFDQYLIDEAIGDLEEFIGQNHLMAFVLAVQVALMPN